MNDTIINARTETRILRPGEGPDRNTPCVRVFRHSPGFVELQIRAQGPTVLSRHAADRKTYSGASLDADTLRAVIRALREGLAEIDDFDHRDEMP